MSAPLRPPLYPVGLVVAGRPCLVVGGGKVAGRKIDALLRCQATVTVVAPVVHEAMAVLASSGAIAEIEGPPLDVQLRPYRRGEVAAYRLVVTATGDPAVDGAVHADAEEAGVWVNSADDVEHCTFVLPAVHRAGPVSVAVSTGGTSPALAGWLRNRLAEGLPPRTAELAGLLDEARSRLKAHGLSTESVAWHDVLDGEVPGLVSQGYDSSARAVLAKVVDDAIEHDAGD